MTAPVKDYQMPAIELGPADYLGVWVNLFTNGFILPWTLRCYPLVVIQILIISLTTYLTLAEKFNLFTIFK